MPTTLTPWTAPYATPSKVVTETPVAQASDPNATPRSDRYRDLAKPVPDPVFYMNGLANKDFSKKKVNLVIGAYRNAHGKPAVLEVVKAAERYLVSQDPYLLKEYQPIDGNRAFLTESVKLLLGRFISTPERLARVAMVQTLSGTGAIRVGAELFKQVLPSSTPVYFSNPTWANHPGVFQSVGFNNVRYYKYYDRRTNGLDFKGMFEDLKEAPKDSIVVLHLCAHNPTGADPTPEQWELLADLCLERHFNVMFDSAYQGYASGSLQRDAYAARLFATKGVEFCTAQSYSKNMGLYGERVGCFSVLCGTQESATLVTGFLKNIIRTMYSNPPLHGARVAHRILADPELRAAWEEELSNMANRIMYMRQTVYKELLRLKTPGKWDHVINQIGMFSYLGLSKEQCERLSTEFHVYLMPSGRANMAGLTKDTAVYLARCIHSVVIKANKPIKAKL